MTIVVSPSTSAGSGWLYSDLQAKVALWLNRSDLSAMIPEFIRLVEDRLNRALRVKQMETQVPATEIETEDSSVAMPDGMVGVKALWIDGYETSPLQVDSYEALLSRGTSGIAARYSLVGDRLYFDGSGTVSGVMYESIPALSNDNTTNWLLTAHPSAYLYGALAEAFHYTRNQAESDRWTAKFETVLADITGTDARDRFSGPLVMRAR